MEVQAQVQDVVRLEGPVGRGPGLDWVTEVTFNEGNFLFTIVNIFLYSNNRFLITQKKMQMSTASRENSRDAAPIITAV
jgi:hypothetical protein